MPADNQHALDRLYQHPFDDRHCLLCGCLPAPDDATREHVFPKWLQHRYALWDKELNLTNETAIPYRQLTVLCCKRCNGQWLRSLEDDVAAAVRSGRKGLLRLPRIRIFQWLAKLFLGVLIKETGLRRERRDPSSNPIIPPAFLRERYTALMFWLNTVRARVEVFGAEPTSIFLREAQVPDDVDHRFDFVDNVNAASVAMRLEDTAIFAHFLDLDSHTDQLGPEFHDLFPYPLHPLQFREMAARFIYKNYLLDMQLDLEVEEVEKDVSRFFMTPRASRPDGTLWRDWNDSEYATLLSYYWNVPKEQIFEAPNRVTTTLRDAHGRHTYMDVREQRAIQFCRF